MRNPLARYYAFATKQRRGYAERLWLILPVGISLAAMFLLAWIVRVGLVTDRAALRILVVAILVPIPIWLGYVAYRFLLDAFMAARWLGRETGPSWRSGWRTAWRTLRGRSGKTG